MRSDGKRTLKRLGLLVAIALVLCGPRFPLAESTDGGVAAGDSLESAGVAAHPYDPGQILPPPCPLCHDDQPVPVHRWTLEEVRRVGDAYADSNVVRLATLDSLLRAGVFGDPASRAAHKQAHLLARLLTLNAYSYMIHYGSDRDTVWEADESVLRPAFADFSDPGIVPLARLERARLGLGHMCARYDLSQMVKTETIIGGRRLRVRTDDVSIQGQRTRVLIMDLPTSLNDVVEVCLTEHVCMNVERRVVDGPPAPYEVFIVDSMRGLWVRKAGLHRPEAFVFWVTPRDPRRTAPPDLPLIGARIYVPHLVLRLPSILPDLHFDDLREVDLPQPILALDYFRTRRSPSWLEVSSMRGYKGWDSIGPLPDEIRRRFPDH